MSLSFAAVVIGMIAGAAPIRFRAEQGGTAAGVVQALVLAVMLLGAVLGLLLWARRKGWLDPWLRQAGARAQGEGMRNTRTLRLSRKTTLHEVQWQDRRLLIVESTASVQVHMLEEGRDAGS